ncbi:MAG: NAD-dependent epimerase/dehydratase family protein [Defluviitaleaceae bacterium]|nr:NAD-dependent epimerase/dehydratase family protein [Defluviitaleaceae bacterium]
MKRVLIVGANSYIGDSFAAYAKDRLEVDIVDSYDGWKTASYENYDNVLLVAGIAHKKADKDLHFAVNHDLAINMAKRARDGGVEQFIYISSMAVYGITQGEITHDTKPNPDTKYYYALSKFQAEEELTRIMENLCIVRPPMVYGPGCPGNFSKLVSLTRKLPIFPDIKNKRSMIFIDNLCAFLLQVIENNLAGVQMPQNKEHVNTTGLVRAIAMHQGKRIRTTRFFNPIISLLIRFVPQVWKLFGSLYYSHSDNEDMYNVVGFEESIKKTL